MKTRMRLPLATVTCSLTLKRVIFAQTSDYQLAMTDIIDYQRYPLNNLDAKTSRQWIADIKKRLDKDGSCLFHDFVLPDALNTMSRQALDIAHLAYPGPTEVSPYFFNYRLGEDQVLLESHPLRRKGKRNLAQVATDLIPPDCLLNQLYRSEEMLQFLAAIIDQPVYRNMDPYQSLNISVMNEGGCQQWHFDSGNMVTTLLLQEPEAGGVFEYSPGIRSDQNEHFDAVQAVLDGDLSSVKRNHLRAGTLSLFRGHYSLHRVTEVEGNCQRLQAILGYTTRQGHIGNKESSILHYGPRVAEIELQQPRYPA